MGDDITLFTLGEVDVLQDYTTDKFAHWQEATDGAGHFLRFACLGFSKK